MIQAIVFDIGGVLLRTEDRTTRNDLAEKFGLQPAALERLVFDSQAARASTIGQASGRAVWQNVADQLALSTEAIEEFKEAFWAGDHLDHEFIRFLKECHQEFTTALLSNAWEGARAELWDKFGIKEGRTVDKILFSYELGVAKPDLKIYQILADTLDCEYPQILFVDDFIENILAARELGIHAIHYQPGMDLISKIRGIIHLN